MLDNTHKEIAKMKAQLLAIDIDDVQMTDETN